tara:strand:- start:180 stop:575 length:396 start_codon:yes stop_codon:yes gene_type:complete
MSDAKKFISKWHSAIKDHDSSSLDILLRDDVTFFSPVVFKPIEGKQLVLLYLQAAYLSFNMSKFKYIKEIHQNANSILEFETFIDDIAVNGIDMIEWDEAGKIITFKVMIRPLKAINKVHEKMVDSLNSFN